MDRCRVAPRWSSPTIEMLTLRLAVGNGNAARFQLISPFLFFALHYHYKNPPRPTNPISCSPFSPLVELIDGNTDAPIPTGPPGRLVTALSDPRHESCPPRRFSCHPLPLAPEQKKPASRWGKSLPWGSRQARRSKETRSNQRLPLPKVLLGEQDTIAFDPLAGVLFRLLSVLEEH